MPSNHSFVQNINQFWFLNCPECPFKTKIHTKFESHAHEKHPWSSAIFGTNKESLDKIETEEEQCENVTLSIEQNDDQTTSLATKNTVQENTVKENMLYYN